mmetsp:Transcript_121934/g.352158  ORF Transcript_121934/g.352158 Transcript_121934/m.352158 type:complete len:409 (+) Transcript_121934:84-1310(+)
MANPPSDRVFVGDLPGGITQDEVQNIFSAYGTVVDCKVLDPRQEGQNACALLRFQDVEEATWVVENLNGNIAETMTDPVVVRFANNGKGSGGKGSCGKSSGGFKGGGGGGKGSFLEAWSSGGGSSWQAKSEPAPSSDNVFIGDLPESLDQEALSSIFGAYGTVVQCKLIPPKVPGSKACALVRFQSVEEAEWVVENLNNNIAEGLEEPIVAKFANTPGGPPLASDGGKHGGGKHGVGKGLVYRSEPYPSGKGKLALTSGKDGGYGKSVGGSRGKGAVAESIWEVVGTLKKSGVQGLQTVPHDHQLVLGNLPPDCTDLDLYKICAPFGAIASPGVKAMLHDDGTCRGFGFVNFLEASSALIAKQTLESFEFPSGMTLQCTIKHEPSAKGEKGGKGIKGKGEKGKSKGKW